MKVRPKKKLGQHFLQDLVYAEQLAAIVKAPGNPRFIVEIGPGMGALTDFLVEGDRFETHMVEIDEESVRYLNSKYPSRKNQIHHLDFLNMDLQVFLEQFGKEETQLSIAGNFPYNISSQILFKVLEFREIVPVCAGMFQKEVAVRIAASQGNRNYGILSVLMQTYYSVKLEFEILPSAFRPSPKVDSAVLSFKKLDRKPLDCTSETLFKVVKTAFNQRRKTLRNALKPIISELPGAFPFLDNRAEQCSPENFELLASTIEGAALKSGKKI